MGHILEHSVGVGESCGEGKTPTIDQKLEEAALISFLSVCKALCPEAA